MSIIDINDKNIDDIVAQNSNVFIDCWTPEFKEECKEISALFDEYSDRGEYPVVFGKMDASKNPLTAKKYGIQVFPHVLLFKDGKPQGAIFGLINRDRLNLNLYSYRRNKQ